MRWRRDLSRKLQIRRVVDRTRGCKVIRTPAFPCRAGLIFSRAKPLGETMIKWRAAILAIAIGLSILSPSSSARADQAFQRFLPLLIDLDGWQGKKPDGMSMELPNASVTTATRDYARGPAKLHASVIKGQAAVGALAPLKAGMNLQTSDGHMISGTMHGMQVLKNYTTKDKSGALIVALGTDAIFNLAYEGLTEEEALALAEKFDWKAIQAAAQMK